MKKAVSASVVSIESGRVIGQDPPPASPSFLVKKRPVLTQHSARQFAAKFYGMGKSTLTAMRETGVSRAEADAVHRSVGTREWERRALGVAA